MVIKSQDLENPMMLAFGLDESGMIQDTYRIIKGR